MCVEFEPGWALWIMFILTTVFTFQRMNRMPIKVHPLIKPVGGSPARTAMFPVDSTTIVEALFIATITLAPPSHLTTCSPLQIHTCFHFRAKWCHPFSDRHPFTWEWPRGPQGPIRALCSSPHLLLLHHRRIISKADWILFATCALKASQSLHTNTTVFQCIVWVMHNCILLVQFFILY